ncbi:zf-HC2 domain-containing protein [Candidatus Poribacteria bacterium]|nr:zf-HC2 domain-containing protein [Candidatus Poribacteria bacterium]
MRRHLRDEEMLSYIYGEMDEARSKEIEEHLRVCHECRSIFNELKGSVELLDELKVERKSDVSDQHLRLFYDRLHKRRRRRKLKLAMAFSALILILGTSPLWFNMPGVRDNQGMLPAKAVAPSLSISDVEIEIPDYEFVVTMTTVDPDVDIVWVISENKTEVER